MKKIILIIILTLLCVGILFASGLTLFANKHNNTSNSTDNNTNGYLNK